MGYILER